MYDLNYCPHPLVRNMARIHIKKKIKYLKIWDFLLNQIQFSWLNIPLSFIFFFNISLPNKETAN